MTHSTQATFKDQAGKKNMDVGRLDTDAGMTQRNLRANEETEGATNAVDAPLLPPETMKAEKTDGR